MLKFLRKYNKWILVVGGSLLMVAFVAPQAIQRLGPKRESQVVAKIGKRSVTQGQLDLASREFGALGQFSPSMMYFMLRLPQRTTAEHWLLLTEAAERGGFVAAGGDGLDWIPDLAKRQLEIQISQTYQVQWTASLEVPEIAQQVNDIEQSMIESRGRVAARAGFTPPEFDQALAKARGVMRMLEAYGASPRFGEQTIKRQTKHDQDRAFADVVWISGRRAALIDGIEPTEEQMAAHFERFRGQQPDENEYGIGYTLPERIKLSWIEIDADLIAMDITPDPVEVAKAWDRDRTRYPGDLADERVNIERALKTRQAERLVAEADRVIRERTAAALRQVDRLGEVPENWDEQCPSWEQLAGEISAAASEISGDAIRLPIVKHRDSEWLTREDLQKLPGIGTSRVRLGAREIAFADAALSVRTLGDDQGLGFRVGVPVVQAYAVDSASPRRYYFTVEAARDVSPPDSMDEIRERLERETAAFLAFERLEADADALLAEAKEGGLKTLAERYSPPDVFRDEEEEVEPGSLADLRGLSVQPLVQVKWDPTDPNFITGVQELKTQSFCDAVMGRASTLDPMLRDDALPADRRWLSVVIPAHQGVALVKINAYAQITRQDFEKYAASSIQRARLDVVVGDERSSPFGFETLAKRMGFRLTGKGESGSDTPESDQTEEEPAEG